MTQNVSLEGKTAVVTGASSGIGRAIAESLGSAGARTYLVGRTASAMEDCLARIEEQGGKGEIVTLDVRDAAALQGLIDRAADDTGRLDIMVNNAGLSYPGAIVDGEIERWREMLEVNVLALLVGSQAAVKAMRRAGNGGHIVNISSVAALMRDSGVYGATKHAVNCIASTLREELAAEDIRVVNIMPGAVATNFARTYDPEIVKGIGAVAGIELDWEPGDHIPDEALEKVQIQMEKLLAAPSDIADAVLYAVSAPLRLNIDEVVVRPAQQLQI